MRPPRFLLVLALALTPACGDDESGGDPAKIIPPGATAAPGDLPPAAAYVELRGTEVGVSSGFACALTNERKVICWGDLKYQHLQQLNALGKTGVEVKLPSPAKTLSFSGDVGCALVEDGSVRCWGSQAEGNNGAGKIGAPAEASDSVSIAGFPGPVDVLHMAGSNDSDSCAISQGRIFCWDPIRQGTVAELPGGITDAKLVARDSSRDVTCVVRADGKLYCWGSNEWGQLGIPIGGTSGAPPKVTTPTEVPELTNVTAVEVGDDRVCAVSNGNIVCWGDHWYAPLTEAQRKEPIPKLTVAGVSNVTKLRKSPSSSEYCAISAGKAYCFAPGSLDKAPVALEIAEPGATDIALNQGTRCGVFAEGRVKCWGSSSYPSNGDGGFVYHPVPTFVPGVTGATRLFATQGGACVLDRDNHASCWGGVPLNRAAPPEIGDGHVQRWPALDNATFIGHGNGYPQPRCGVFGGALMCAAKPTETSPAPFKGLTNVVDFAMSASEGCARLTDGTLTCWRENKDPAVVKGLGGVKAIVLVSGRVGGARACVLQEGVKCWNGVPGPDDADKVATPQAAGAKLSAGATDLHADLGELRCGLTPSGVACDVETFGQTELAGDISGTAGASLVTVGQRHACALAGGRVQCWGNGNAGQLGSGNFGASASAFPVSNAAVPVALGAGTDFTCGLAGDGRVQCWGSNMTGIVSPPPAVHELPNQVKVIF